MAAEVFEIDAGEVPRRVHGEYLAKVRRHTVVRLRRKEREEAGLCVTPSCELYGTETFGLCEHNKKEGKGTLASLFRCKDEYCPNYESGATTICPGTHPPHPGPEEGPKRA